MKGKRVRAQWPPWTQTPSPHQASTFLCPPKIIQATNIFPPALPSFLLLLFKTKVVFRLAFFTQKYFLETIPDHPEATAALII